jgi:hypothetical protein
MSAYFTIGVFSSLWLCVAPVKTQTDISTFKPLLDP